MRSPLLSWCHHPFNGQGAIWVIENPWKSTICRWFMMIFPSKHIKTDQNLHVVAGNSQPGLITREFFFKDALSFWWHLMVIDGNCWFLMVITVMNYEPQWSSHLTAMITFCQSAPLDWKLEFPVRFPLNYPVEFCFTIWLFNIAMV